MVNVFITGASGFVGSHLTPILLAAGHKITAIARSESAAQKLEDQGITTIRATLEDIDVLAKAAGEADAVIHLGFIHDSRSYAESVEADLAVITAFGTALKGSNKTLITTSAIPVAGVPTPTELSPGKIPPRAASEQLTLSFSSPEHSIRSHVVRLPPTVHGDTDRGFLAHYIGQSRKAGFAGYIGEGENHWPATHVKDAVQVYKLVLENASGSLKGGEVLHASQEAGITLKTIASAVAKRLGIPTKSITKEEAGQTYTFLALFLGIDCVASSELTRRWLGWESVEKGVIEDLEGSGWYFEETSVTKF
ncbi:hypothetical protein L202_01776 [Cryptococcus amylolentus CBS 6039]|uniref:NAD-dependent epimerase/dehydratase domain-containing protein n=2 Tax=Cryptococcus amylolentus TaxID=104669 RepID=A0A1E3I4W2_9TREE|nr:hypothetical protein L202_01776 [Cryptococcus amylolentus CBS 6039]ODN83680.1 hypothetical protein L202_01776 [Cryptococcus amylolentus CBS 6039]ODO11155.1 hypothetical protein I350_01758 [Cryptococcus amylolentus CBS 6273]